MVLNLIVQPKLTCLLHLNSLPNILLKKVVTHPKTTEKRIIPIKNNKRKKAKNPLKFIDNGK